jgi:hypothetical protein
MCSLFRAVAQLGGGGEVIDECAVIENMEESSRNTCSSAPSSATNLTRSHLGLRPGLRSDNSASRGVTYNMALSS